LGTAERSLIAHSGHAAVAVKYGRDYDRRTLISLLQCCTKHRLSHRRGVCLRYHAWEQCWECWRMQRNRDRTSAVTSLRQRLTTRSPAVTMLANRTDCQWASRSSKINDFHFIWKGVCHFQLLGN